MKKSRLGLYFSLCFGIFVLISNGLVQAEPLKLATLKKALKPHVIKIQNPNYPNNPVIEYEGFWIQDLISQNKDLSLSDGAELAVVCADGFSPSFRSDEVESLKLFLAFKEKGSAGFKEVLAGKKMVAPGPFWLLSASKDTTSLEKFVWPYQIVEIKKIKFEEKFKPVVPIGVSESSEVQKGYMVFKNNCIRCHSINQSGGVVGPELNVPKNITEYWDEKVLFDFIRNPEAFRWRSKMPRLTYLSDADLTSVIAYFKHMKTQKIQTGL